MRMTPAVNKANCDMNVDMAPLVDCFASSEVATLVAGWGVVVLFVDFGWSTTTGSLPVLPPNEVSLRVSPFEIFEEQAWMDQKKKITLAYITIKKQT